MHVDYIVKQLNKSDNTLLVKVTNQLNLKAKQTAFNASSVKSCPLMPESVKESITQEANDSAIILEHFLGTMQMFQNMLNKENSND